MYPECMTKETASVTASYGFPMIAYSCGIILKSMRFEIWIELWWLELNHLEL